MNKLILLFFVCTACSSATPSTKTESHPLGVGRAKWTIAGALIGERSITELADTADDTIEAPVGVFGGPRIACTMVNEKGKVAFVFDAVDNYGEDQATGIYLRVADFSGARSYALTDETTGRAWTFDHAHLQSCARPNETACFQSSTDCTIAVDKWDFGAGVVAPLPGLPAAVRYGLGHGTFHCGSLVNEATGTRVSVDGSFICRVEDWTAVE